MGSKPIVCPYPAVGDYMFNQPSHYNNCNMLSKKPRCTVVREDLKGDNQQNTQE